MPAVQCPVLGCEYTTDDLDAVIVAALITAHSMTHAPGPITAAKVDRVKRPVISAAGSSEEWTYFLSRWTEYVDATKITGRDKVVQLLECCDEQLRKDLTRSAGGSLTGKTADEVMAAIKKLAVRNENTMVARVTLHNMRQDRDEPVRSFCARLQGQAGVCKYIIKCPGCDIDVNYTEHIVRDALARGLVDPDIQLDLLGDKNQNMSLEEVSQLIEAKEEGKRSASRLLDSHAAEAASSSYKKTKQTAVKDKNDTCSYCGKKGHGKAAIARIRVKECPAFGHKCKHCTREHHFETVCRSKDKPKAYPPTTPRSLKDCEGAVFDTLCSISNTDNILTSKAIAIDHHLYDHLADTWIRKSSRPQPFINLSIRISSDDYSALGFTLPRQTKPVILPAMADTGCQSCLAGIKVINRLGLNKSALIPVTMKMHAANRKGITILGATVLRIAGKDESGQVVETRQMTYVTDNSDKLFISREACIALGIISDSFPTVGEINDIHQSTIAPTLLTASDPIETNQLISNTKSVCDCPIRQLPPQPPKKLPFAPIESNRVKLREFLIDHYKSSTFNTCDHQPLPMMAGPPMHLMVDPDAKPVAHHTPVPVPLHWQEEVKAGLDQDVRLGVLEPVPIGEPVTWCHRMVVCAKKNGKPRRTVDFQQLNKHATRETHHTPSPFHQARLVPHGTKKTVLDAWNGYHSVPLHCDDRHLTTFITPWGRYRYNTAPQGYIASGDGYTRRYDEIVADIPCKTKCVDDVLLWADSLENCFNQTVQWLDICGRQGITLNPEKFVFGQDIVEFAGFEITPNSVRPCMKYLQAILDFPAPKNLTDVRSWFGLVNQVSYTFSMAKTMLPFRQLLKPGIPFAWDDDLNDAFEDSKAAILNEIEEGVKIFDPSKPTCLATDWSKNGIGFWLFQKHCTCPGQKPFCCHTGWKITLVGSRFTHSAESRYAPIEGEALAVADALDKARYFVLGCRNLIVAVDHKPLLKILGDRSLEDISNSRLRNLKEKTLRYRFSIIHVPGVIHRAADCVSRYPTGSADKLTLQDDIAAIDQCIPTSVSLLPSRKFLEGIRASEPDTSSIEECVIASVTTSLDSIAMKSVTWDKVRIATASDDNMNQLLHLIESGLPESRQEFPEQLRDYFQFREHLHTIDGVVIYNDRVVVPPSLRQDILSALHAAHQGVTSMISRAEASVFWPGITPAISSYRTGCNHCNRIAPSNPSAPPYPMISPDYPFQCVCADFFHYKGVNYLVIVDRYSNWPIVERSSDGVTGLITCLRRTLVTFGIPDELASDGGPEFTATATRQFLQDWGVHHRLSSVAYPHSNCRAEVGVKTVKRLLADSTGPNGELDTDALQRAILQYRNTPDRDTKLSPAMCVFGHPIRDFIPIPPGRYKPHDTWQDTLAAREEALRNRHLRDAERWTEHTKRLSPLEIGNHVRVQNQIGSHPLKWDKTGIIIEVRQFDQYVVKMDGSGRVTIRNRKFLRKYIPVKPPQPTRTIEDYPSHSQPSQPHITKPISLDLGSEPKLTPAKPITRPELPSPTLPRTPGQPPYSPPTPGSSTRVNTPSNSTPTIADTQSRSPGLYIPPRRRHLIFGDATPSQYNERPETTVTTTGPVVTKNRDSNSNDKPRQSGRTTQSPKWHSDYDMTSS